MTRLAAALSTEGARRLVPLVGVNSVPVAGVFFAGWDGATALTLYWWENLVGSLLIALRILVHRASTRKRGHHRLHLSLEAHNARGTGTDGSRPGSFLGEFLAAGLAATVVHGLLLWFVVRRLLGEGPESEQLRQGVIAVSAFQLLGLAIDLVGIRNRPFAWIREIAEAGVRRVTLIHLVVIVGWWVSLKQGGLDGFFGPFAVIKALADVGSALALLGVRADGPEAPGWLTATIHRITPDRGRRDFAAHWRKLREEERRLRERDEEARPEGGRARWRRARKRHSTRGTGG